MTETTLALCQKPVLGVMMWLASMCVANQALKEAYVDLSSSGVILNQKIDVPMDERYSLFLSFRPLGPSDSTAMTTPFGSYICNPGSKENIAPVMAGENRVEPSVFLELTIATPDGKLFAKELLSPQCSPDATHSNTIGFGYVEMKRGKYILTIANRHPVAPNGGGRVQATLHGQGAGFP
jgi:hypothetical protein